MPEPHQPRMSKGTNATRAERDLIVVYKLVKRFQEEKIHGEIVLHFNDGVLVNGSEKKGWVVPKEDTG